MCVFIACGSEEVIEHIHNRVTWGKNNHFKFILLLKKAKAFLFFSWNVIPISKFIITFKFYVYLS